MFYRSHLVTAALAVLMAAALAADAAAAPAGAPAPVERTLVNPNSVVVFPFERPPESQAAPAVLGELIAARIRQGLDASRQYTATLYYPTSPLVQRNRAAAAGQAGISQQDIEGVIDPRGVIDQAAALRIANFMGTAAVMLGSVEAYRHDAQANTVTLTATAQLLQVPGGTPIKTVGVTATANVSAGAAPEAVAQAAAAEVARRALTEMGIQPAAPGPAAAAAGNGKKRAEAEVRATGRKSGWIPVGILLGILATSIN